MDKQKLHFIARALANKLDDPDKKQLRFNEIVNAALEFYASDPLSGVSELVESCDRKSKLYAKGVPMWKALSEQYRWMNDHTDMA